MVSRMKTTVEISDDLMNQAKHAARQQGTTLRALIEEGLRGVLEHRPARQPTFRLRDASVRGDGLQPEFRDATWAQILEASYDWRRGL